ncbi:MAG: hypothetical protein WEB06_07260 [Actinomycetota bacterium]
MLATAALLGVGVGGLLHRLLVGAFEGWDRLAVVPSARGAALREDLLTLGPWAAVTAGVIALAITGRRRAAGRGRRIAGLSVAVAGLVVLLVGELELHVFRTLGQGWESHDLFWDVVFHLPGETIAFAGWLLLPGGTGAAGRAASQTS